MGPHGDATPGIRLRRVQPGEVDQRPSDSMHGRAVMSIGEHKRLERPDGLDLIGPEPDELPLVE
jgi:hypothetical protein